ncbi:hypothetical protein [Pseudobutyrivibrio sp. MD2005]|uniref:hypothetical protein n=1 Tax=Pseudobutyrivibrio sp. MD2005 TaxID=1410616 RepID=UPI0004814653|nr:hypothetical protein [Pseudobutyrivibrio sp. MD2005]
MDILKYIESHAIQNKLSNVKYEFSATEMAWLIWLNGTEHPLTIRHEDWQWIIDNMPDSTVPERMNCRYWPSLHDLIRNYMSFEKHAIDEYEKAGDHAVYSYAYKCLCDKEWTANFENAFSSLEKCIDTLRNDMLDENKISQIRKTYIDRNEYIKVEYNPNMEKTFIEKSWLTEAERALLSESFNGMWFDFPTPFKQGDLVSDNKNNIYVLKSLPGWIEQSDNPKEVAFKKERFEKVWDVTDMMPIGYGVTDDGQVWLDGIAKTYLELEVCTKPLENENRVLGALREYFQRNLNIEQFIALQRKVLYEQLERELHLEDLILDRDLRRIGF